MREKDRKVQIYCEVIVEYEKEACPVEEARKAMRRFTHRLMFGKWDAKFLPSTDMEGASDYEEFYDWEEAKRKRRYLLEINTEQTFLYGFIMWLKIMLAKAHRIDTLD